MKTQRTGTFLVDGVKCELAIDEQAISWWPASSAPPSLSSSSSSSPSKLTATRANNSDSNSKRKIKSVNFSQVIGIKSAFKKQEHSKFALNNGTGRLGYGSPLRPAIGRSKERKIKIYYVKRNENKSVGQLLKLKKLSIEWQPGKSSNMTATTEARSVLVAEQAAEVGKQSEISEPPSCYASDGSNSRLSSLSQLTTATTTTASDGSSTTTTTSSSPVEPQLLPSLGPLWVEDKERNVIKTGGELDRLVRLLEAAIERQRTSSSRPRRLLVFVNPFGGKGKAVHLYKLQVRRLFELANVEVKLVVTKYANHARDTIEDPMFNVESFDGIVCVGGDGMFSELMNGLLFRYNRDALLKAEARRLNSSSPTNSDSSAEGSTETGANAGEIKAPGLGDNSGPTMRGDAALDKAGQTTASAIGSQEDQRRQIDRLRAALGGIGQQFVSPPVPLGVIGAGSTDANSFGLIGTNDVITATLNIILGHQINIDVCSVHTLDEDRLLRFVSTFVAYGYFGDVIRESEKLRWLGPSRYDVTGVNTLMKNRTYKGLVKILVSSQDSSPSQGGRCSAGCQLCQLSSGNQTNHCELANGGGPNVGALPSSAHDSQGTQLGELKFVEKRGPFVGVNAAVTACRCPQTKKGFSPNNHLANGCADLILVHPCTRLQYIQYLMRTAGTKKSAFDLKYVEAYRCRQFEFVAQRRQPVSGAITKSGGSLSSGATSSTNSIDQSTDGSSTNRDKELGDRHHQSAPVSSWNADGEILDEQSVRVKVNNQLLRVFGTGEPVSS